LKPAVIHQYSKMAIWVFLLIIHLTPLPPAFGEENTQSSIWTSFQENWSPKLDIDVWGAYYYEDSTLEPEEFGLTGNATLELSKDLGRGLMLRIDPKVNAAPLNTGGVRLFVEDQEDKPIFTLNEAFLAWYGETTEIEVGKKIYSWKVADGLSPVDTLNPTDITEPLDVDKIGIPSVSVLKMFELVNIQAVFLPVLVADRSPPDTSRWTGGASYVNQSEQTTVTNRDLPDNWFEKVSVASKISSSTLLPGWDLAAIYRYGYSSRGVVQIDFDELSSSAVVKNMEYPAYNLFGFTFSTAWSDIVGHGEAALYDTRDNAKGEDYLSYILGVTYTNYSWMADLFDEIGFIMEYAGEAVLKEREADSSYLDPSTSRGLSDNIIGSIDFKINEDHIAETTFTYNFTNEDSVFDFKGRSRLNDHLQVVYGYQILSGDPASFLGQWDANDRFYMEMAITY